MWSCHQSRFVIDHHVTITASFDEHDCICHTIYHSTTIQRCNELKYYLLKSVSMFSGLACQRGGEMSFSLHITATLMWSVYGDRLACREGLLYARYTSLESLWPIRKNGCAMVHIHITAIFDELGCGAILWHVAKVGRVIGRRSSVTHEVVVVCLQSISQPALMSDNWRKGYCCATPWGWPPGPGGREDLSKSN